MSMTVLQQNGTGLPRSVGTMQLVFARKWLNLSFQMLFILTHQLTIKIEEVGSANFGITADNEFVTPLSPSILSHQLPSTHWALLGRASFGL